MDILLSIYHALNVFSTILSMILLGGIVYVIIRLTEFRKQEAHEHHAHVMHRAHDGDHDNKDKSTQQADQVFQWNRVKQYLLSQNPSDWKIAILEANIMLEEMITDMGYEGESLGEKLKQLNPNTFPYIDMAWQANKLRNEIAHGRELTLTRTEAERTIKLYETVFRAAKYI